MKVQVNSGEIPVRKNVGKIMENIGSHRLTSISTVWVVGQFDIGQLGCGTSLVQHFGSSKFWDK